jgi:hypothetical protein
MSGVARPFPSNSYLLSPDSYTTETINRDEIIYERFCKILSEMLHVFQ